MAPHKALMEVSNDALKEVEVLLFWYAVSPGSLSCKRIARRAKPKEPEPQAKIAGTNAAASLE